MITINLLGGKWCKKCGKVTERYGKNGRCKECARAWANAYHQEHREECLERMKADYQAQRQDRLEQAKTYRQAHPERVREQKKEYSLAHRQEIREQGKAYRAILANEGLCRKGCGRHVPVKGQSLCGECIRKQGETNFMRNYGIPRSQAIKTLEEQGGICPICLKPIRFAGPGEKVPRAETACQDHVHTTGQLRGIICNSCNIAVGQDETLRLEGLIRYLRGPRLVIVFPNKGGHQATNQKRKDLRHKIAAEQSNKCACCQDTLPAEHGGKVHLDHDHKTGLVRGVLCLICNRDLGLLQDSPAIIQKAIDYLAYWRAQAASNKKGVA
jgi:hypothetical protein